MPNNVNLEKCKSMPTCPCKPLADKQSTHVFFDTQKTWVCLCMSLLAVAFLWLNLKTSLSVVPWTDEVMQVDAGINLHLGKGWISTAWQHQSQNSFWVANNPLYTLLIFGWVSILGIDPVAVRSMNYVLVLGIAWLLVDACRRKGLIQSTWAGCLLALLIICDQATAFVYRSGRADLATMLVVTLLFWVFMSVQEPVRRRRMLLLLAIPLLLSGLQSIPYVVLLFALDCMITRKVRIPDILAIMSGCAFGGLLMAFVFLWKQSLLAFVTETFASGYNIVGAGLQALIIRDHAAIVRFIGLLKALSPPNVLHVIAQNNSLVPLIVFLLGVSTLCFLQSRKSNLGTIAIVGLVAAICIPYGLIAAGRYAFYYAWMGAAPVAIVFVVTLERCRLEKKWFIFTAGLLAAIVSVLLGMPTDIWRQTQKAGPEEYKMVEKILRNETRPGDVVYGDPSFYYASKKQGVPFFSTTYAGGRAYRHMSDAERSQVTILLLRPEQLTEAIDKLGDGWTKTDRYELRYGFSVLVWKRLAPGASGH